MNLAVFLVILVGFSVQAIPEMTSRTVIRTAFEKCLAAVEPRQIVRNKISISPSSIQLSSSQFPLSNSTRIVLISLGKASIRMARGALDILKSPLLQKTIVLAPEQQENEFRSGNDSEFDEVYFGAKNNLPDEKSIFGTQKVIENIGKFDGKDTIFVFLISGGGSALFCSPHPSITLSQKLSTIKTLQSHGATIEELNIIRQKLSIVKGGQLLNHIKLGQSVSLLISDVIGDKVDIIASGPTVIPSDKRKSVKEVLEGLGIGEKDLEPMVWKVLMEDDESPSPPRHLNPPHNHIISSNIHALRSASEFLTSSGYHTSIITSSLSGNAAEIGKELGKLVISGESSSLLNRQILQNLTYPSALLFGGETTVNLAENPGKGGRNQEMVLSCFDFLKNEKPAKRFTFLSAGTDGQDGPTNAAGAIISNSDLQIPSPTSSESLANSDSYNFWKTFNDGKNHLITGPSGTNVMDIQILLLDEL